MGGGGGGGALYKYVFSIFKYYLPIWNKFMLCVKPMLVVLLVTFSTFYTLAMTSLLL